MIPAGLGMVGSKWGTVSSGPHVDSCVSQNDGDQTKKKSEICSSVMHVSGVAVASSMITSRASSDHTSNSECKLGARMAIRMPSARRM